MTVKRAKIDLYIAFLLEFLTACEFGFLYLLQLADSRLIEIPLKIMVIIMGSVYITIMLCVGWYYINLCLKSLRDAREEEERDVIFDRPSFNPKWLEKC